MSVNKKRCESILYRKKELYPEKCKSMRKLKDYFPLKYSTKVDWKIERTKFGTFWFKITQPLTIHQVLVERSENLRHAFFGLLAKMWRFSINQGLN